MLELVFTADEAPNIAETKAGEVLTVRITITMRGQASAASTNTRYLGCWD